MSVVMILRVPGDPSQFEAFANANADMITGVANAGKSAGAISHLFAGGDGEIVVVDEWPDEASFQKFFQSQPDIPKLMEGGGATGQPQVSFYRILDSPDRF
jgi:hypothetical protein